VHPPISQKDKWRVEISSLDHRVGEPPDDVVVLDLHEGLDLLEGGVGHRQVVAPDPLQRHRWTRTPAAPAAATAAAGEGAGVRGLGRVFLPPPPRRPLQPGPIRHRRRGGG